MGLLLTACFNTREPNLPVTSSEWLTPTGTDVLLTNLSKAAISLNVVNFQRCLNAGRYKFTAEPSVSGNNVGNFARWSYNDEGTVINNLVLKKGRSSGNRCVFTSTGAPLFQSPDSVVYTGTYELEIQHQDPNYPYTVFKGNNTLTMVRSAANNEWSIVQWTDNKNSNFPTWSDLKQHFIAP